MPTERPRPVGSRLLRTGSLYAFASLIQRGAAFILIPVYSRYLSPSQFGVVHLSEAVASVVGTIAVFGLPPALGRIYFQNTEGTDEHKTSVSAVVQLSLGLSVGFGTLCIVLGPYAMQLVPRFSVAFHPYLSIAIIAAICLQILNVPLTIARSQERAGKYVALSLSYFGISTAGILVLVVAIPGGSYGMLLAREIAAAIMAAIGIYLVREWLFSKTTRSAASDALRLALPLVPHQLVAFVLGAGNRFFIEYYHSTEQVGLYSMAHSVGMAMSVVTATLMMAWTPVFFQKAKQGGESLKSLGDLSGAMIGGLIVIAGIGCCFGPIAVRYLLDARYAPSSQAVALVIGGYLFHGLFSLFQLAVMQSGKTKLLAPVTALAALGSLAANFILVPKFGFMGSAWGTLVAYVVEAVLVFVLAQRLFKVPYPMHRIAMWLLGFAVVLAASQMDFGQIGSVLVGSVCLTVLIIAVGFGARQYIRKLWVS
ncbi:MAG: oligosaccharide flippase family protein [Polyangiaceae bacterium]|nr:oligosaccharide flippase family protein [Polyangiaceae bacterium]